MTTLKESSLDNAMRLLDEQAVTLAKLRSRYIALLAGCVDLREELAEEISGADEDKGRDQMISGWIAKLDTAIGSAQPLG